ncbi:MAG: Na/Pi symporter [Phycisphaerales bacterium]|nr:Na/Pi symporter [Phycisphaerales bacterium]
MPKIPTTKVRPFWWHAMWALVALYFFLCAINIMGSGLKVIGKETSWLQTAIAEGDNPLVALLAAVLVTAIVQSSSFTTSLIITLVAAQEMSVRTAVFAVMGANIGTSVTGIIVSLGTMRIRRQFRRSYCTALMHAVPNVMTVLLLFPLEWITAVMAKRGPDGEPGVGILTSTAEWLTSAIGLGEIGKGTSPVKLITKPVVSAVKDAINWMTEEAAVLGGVLIAVVGLVTLFCGLVGLVRNLKGAMLTKMEGLFSKVIFRNDFLAWISGLGTTVAVQSSSVSTSLMVPIAGAGAVKLRRVFPYMLGCNIGTTVTGVLAATANPTAGAVSVAIAHVLFNITDNLVWYPLRMIPIRISKWLSSLAARKRKHAFIFLATVFLIAPVIGLVITELFIF